MENIISNITQYINATFGKCAKSENLSFDMAKHQNDETLDNWDKMYITYKNKQYDITFCFDNKKHLSYITIWDNDFYNKHKSFYDKTINKSFHSISLNLAIWAKQNIPNINAFSEYCPIPNEYTKTYYFD